MAQIDVTDAVLDPDFADELLCERLEQLIGNNGIASNMPTSVPFYGVVTSGEGRLLSRQPNGEHITGGICIHTMFALQDGSDPQDGNEALTADVVIWKNKRYTVTKVHDNSHYGRGFVRAECALIPLSG